jgi:hypothetical protein
MRNLMRRALDRLAGSKTDRGEAKRPKGKKAEKAASADPSSAGNAGAPPTKDGRADSAPPSPKTPPSTDGANASVGSRNALIEQALAIRRKQARVFDALKPADRYRLQIIAVRQFQAAFKRPKAPRLADKETAPRDATRPRGPRPRGK